MDFANHLNKAKATLGVLKNHRRALKNLIKPPNHRPAACQHSTLAVNEQVTAKIIKADLHSYACIHGALFMPKPPKEEDSQKAKRRPKSVHRQIVDRRKGRDRRKGFDRRGGIGRRRNQDQGTIERKNITQD